MASRPHVTLFTTQATPSTASGYPHQHTRSSSSSKGSLAIRAPLTISDSDSDSDSVYESNGGYKVAITYSSTNSSDSGFEFDDVLVRGEEFETTSDRPFVRDPDEDMIGASGVFDKYQFPRLFVRKADDESSYHSIVDEDESGGLDELEVVDNPNLKPVIPIAQLSLDDDDDDDNEVSESLSDDVSMMSEVEAVGFSGVVKVPHTGLLDIVNTARTINVLEVEGAEGSAAVNQSELLSPVKVVEGLFSAKFVGVENGSLDSDDNSILAEFIEDKDPGAGVSHEVCDESMVQAKEDGSNKNEEDITSFLEEMQDLEDRKRVFVNSGYEHEVNRIGTVLTDHVFLLSDATRIRKQINVIGDGSVHDFESVINPVFQAGEQELKVEKVRVEAEGPVDCQYNESSFVDVGGRGAFDQGNENEELESKTEPHSYSAVELGVSKVISRVESAYDTTEGNEFLEMNHEIPKPNPNEEAVHLGKGDVPKIIDDDRLEDETFPDSHSLEFVVPNKLEGETKGASDNMGVEEHLLYDKDDGNLILGGSETTKQIINDLDQRLVSSLVTGAGGSQGESQSICGQIINDQNEEINAEKDGKRMEIFGSATLLKAATGAESDGSCIPIKAADGFKLFSPQHPAGSDSSFQSLKPTAPPDVVEDVHVLKDNLSEEDKSKFEKIQEIRVKFLRLVHRLGYSCENSVVGKVLHRLASDVEGLATPVFGLESAKRVAMQVEAEGKDDLDFCLNILVIGKTGVGKSATINSIFGDKKVMTNAFQLATTTVKEIAGVIDGIKIRIFDTPGLRSPVLEQAANQKVLASIKKFMRKFPPDVILYVDRLDTHTRDLDDLPLLRSLTNSLGSSVWRNAIVTLTHAASVLPDGPSGSPLSFEVLVSHRSYCIQKAISQAVGDLHLMDPRMGSPVSLVENHLSCQRDINGESVPPSVQSWKPQLLLMCYSLKILSEVNSISKPQGHFDQNKPFNFWLHSSPLPSLMSSLLRSHLHPKLSVDHDGTNVDSDFDLANLHAHAHAQLMAFKPSQVSNLSEEQRKEYLEEYRYRLKLPKKNQKREEVKRLKEIKEKGKDGGDNDDYMGEDVDQKDGGPATAPLLLPDIILLLSFDSDNPTYRYQSWEPTSKLLVRPLLASWGWDHDCGYDGVNLERNLAITGRFPGTFSVKTKSNKKDFNILLDSSVSPKHRESGSSMAGFDIQHVGLQLAYILRSESEFKNFKINNTAAGISITLLGENMATDHTVVRNCLAFVGNTAAVQSQGDTAYGANMEVQLKGQTFSMRHKHSSLGLSLMKWRDDLSLMVNLLSQFSFGQSSTMAVCGGLSNRRNWKINIKTSSTDQLQVAFTGIVPIAIHICKCIFPGSGERN